MIPRPYRLLGLESSYNEGALYYLFALLIGAEGTRPQRDVSGQRRNEETTGAARGKRVPAAEINNYCGKPIFQYAYVCYE
ncbi:hypothetical protein A33I_08785 [Alkalihalophilus marmarensis DSM 21297]|jgi:hypothetical protein|uniref:Uncharacterized protein n=2 Tax=Alkalihalophilus TaxID=2893060 RepID=U6STS5_9BACI|nr:hypothetical protein A33I_08785 [Alkalihalophilus marmarensis DSM 21297]